MDIQTVGPILAVAVTILGFVLSLVWGFILAAGAKLPAQGDQPHKIKYGDLEIQTDRVVMLLAVCVLAMVLPLGGWYWLTYAVLQDARIYVVATVESSPGRVVSEGEASIVRIIPGGKEAVECPTQQLANGEFTCQFPIRSFRDIFELRVKTMEAGTRKLKIQPVEPHPILTLSPR